MENLFGTLVDDCPYVDGAPGSILAWLLAADLEELAKTAVDNQDRVHCTLIYLSEALEWGVEFGIAAARSAVNEPPADAHSRISRLVQTVKFDVRDRIKATREYNLEQAR